MNKEFYKKLIYESPMAYAYHKVIYDDKGIAVNYEFLDANNSFGLMTSLDANKIIGKKVTDVIPSIRDDSFDWISEYAGIADGKTSKTFESYSSALNRHYSVSVFSFKKGYFVTIFSDITDIVRSKQKQIAFADVVHNTIIETDKNLNILNVLTSHNNPFNIPAQALVGKSMSTFPSYFPVKKISLHCAKAKSTGQKITFEYSVRRTDTRKWYRADCLYTDILNEPRFMFYITDITDKYILEQKLQRTESLFKTMFEQAPIGIMLVKNNVEYTNTNKKMLEILGVSLYALSHIDWKEITHPDDLEKEMEYFDKFLKREISSYSMIKRMLKGNNTYIWCHVTIARLTLAKNRHDDNTYIVMLDDMTNTISATDALKESERSKSVIFSHIPGVAYRCLFDDKWTMLFMSDGCYGLTGYYPKDFINNNSVSYEDIIAPEYRDTIRNEWSNACGTRKLYKGEYEIITAQKERKWVYEQGQCIYDEKDDLMFIEGVIFDITESKMKELEIFYLNSHDSFTGLYNRIHFMNEMQRLDNENHLPLSVIVGDINGLRLINNAFGTKAGDRILLRISRIIRRFARYSDVVARIGGDNFGIILPHTTLADTVVIAELIEAACNDASSASDADQIISSITFGYAGKTDKQASMQQVFLEAEEMMFKRKLLDRKSSHSNILLTIQAALFAKSEETEEHATRLYELGKSIGKYFNLSRKDLDRLQLVSLLHDVGKITIDDRILKKPGKLTDEEWVEMRKHPETGYKIAISSPDLEDIAELILAHHERFDGSGYPNGLVGTQIPLLSRILSVCDAFDAITNDRVYKKAQSAEYAIEEINRHAGTQFDPDVVNAFNMVMKEKNSVDSFI